MVTIEPASASVHIALNAPVPCISGAAGRFDGPGLDTRASNSSHPGAAGNGRRDGPSRLPNTSSWRHITPFGAPVVPPVYSRYRSSGERPHGAATREVADVEATA